MISPKWEVGWDQNKPKSSVARVSENTCSFISRALPGNANINLSVCLCLWPHTKDSCNVLVSLNILSGSIGGFAAHLRSRRSNTVNSFTWVVPSAVRHEFVSVRTEMLCKIS